MTTSTPPEHSPWLRALDPAECREQLVARTAVQPAAQVRHPRTVVDPPTSARRVCGTRRG